jgi:hypothetical protein
METMTLTAQEALDRVIGELDNRGQFELAMLLIDQAGATCREQDLVADALLNLEGRIDGLVGMPACIAGRTGSR